MAEHMPVHGPHDLPREEVSLPEIDQPIEDS
jgi:hypothetical protein